MSLEYLTLRRTVAELSSVELIEATLRQWGDPVRWAMTHVQGSECTIEAVIYPKSSVSGVPSPETASHETASLEP